MSIALKDIMMETEQQSKHKGVDRRSKLGGRGGKERWIFR
jgi:hypothetical protein